MHTDTFVPVPSVQLMIELAAGDDFDDECNARIAEECLLEKEQ